MPVELVFGINYFLFVGYSEYCAFISVEFHAPFIFPMVVIDGSTSDAVSVDSGVPQGSVLGPGFFLYYINDLQSRLTSTVRLFADDTIAYLTISNYISSRSSLHCLHLVYFSLCIWIPDCTIIFY
jgi:hypothetical protein